MKQHFIIKVLTDGEAEAITSIVNFQDCKYPIKYAEAILTITPQLQMLRQFYTGELIYAELISAKVKAPIALSIETSAPCIVFGYYVSGSVLIHLPEETEHITAVDGQNFSMYIPAGKSIWPAHVGESDLFFFVLNTEFLQNNKDDYPALEAMIQKVLTADPKASLSGLFLTSLETKKLLIQMSKFKFETKLELERSIMGAVCALIAQHIVQTQELKQIPYANKDEIVEALMDLLLIEIEKPTIPVIPDLCARFKIDLKSLRRQFKKKFGMSIQVFITSKRMKSAHHLLIVDKLSVSETSLRLGYSALSTFTRLFKKHHGYAPSQAKKSSLN